MAAAVAAHQAADGRDELRIVELFDYDPPIAGRRGMSPARRAPPRGWTVKSFSLGALGHPT